MGASSPESGEVDDNASASDTGTSARGSVSEANQEDGAEEGAERGGDAGRAGRDGGNAEIVSDGREREEESRSREEEAGPESNAEAGSEDGGEKSSRLEPTTLATDPVLNTSLTSFMRMSMI